MSARKVMSYNDMVRLPRTLSKNMAKEVERATKQIAKLLLSEAKAFTTAANVKDTGLYAKSWKVVEFGKSVQLVNTAPYAGVIENGAKFPGKMPPVRALMPWVRRKLPDVLPQERRSIAFAIARKIKRTGIEGKGIMADTLRYSEQQVTEILQAAIAKATK